MLRVGSGIEQNPLFTQLTYLTERLWRAKASLTIAWSETSFLTTLLKLSSLLYSLSVKHARLQYLCIFLFVYLLLYYLPLSLDYKLCEGSNHIQLVHCFISSTNHWQALEKYLLNELMSLTTDCRLSVYPISSRAVAMQDGGAVTKAPESNQRSNLVVFELAVIVLSFLVSAEDILFLSFIFLTVPLSFRPDEC